MVPLVVKNDRRGDYRIRVGHGKEEPFPGEG
jgi:hypothetical protein